MQLHFSPNYVLDEMQWYEINAALKYNYYAVKDNWEQARLITYMIAQTNSKRRLKFEDITTFPWEEEKQEDKPISKEDIERLNKQAQAYINTINNNAK